MTSVKANFIKKKSKNVVPPVVSWIVTRRCNMQCLHCYPSSGPRYDGTELSFSQQENAVTKFASAGIERVFLSGGETLMLPHIFDLIELIHKQGMTTWICTNGSLVNETLSGRIASAGVLGVSVSIDSFEEQFHDNLRAHSGSHSKALIAILNLRQKGVTVNIDYTITRLNRRNIDKLQPMLSELGVKSIFFKRFRPIGRGGQNRDQLALSLDEYRHTIDVILNSYKGFGTELCFEDPAIYGYCRQIGTQEKVRTDGLYALFGCLAGVVWLGIQPNGDVTPCPLMNVVLGNIVNEDLHSIVNNSLLIKRLVDRDDRGGRCRTCDNRWRCGGCRAHAYLENGDSLAEDPFCVYSSIEDQHE